MLIAYAYIGKKLKKIWTVTNVSLLSKCLFEVDLNGYSKNRYSLL